MSLKDYDYKDAFNRMIKVKDNHRELEVIIDELKFVLATIKEESILIHSMRIIMELDFRSSSTVNVPDNAFS